MDNNKIADVLEEAARLYKDEKINWCSGSWVEGDMYMDPPEGQEQNLSMCAEGALLKASGVSVEVINGFRSYAETGIGEIEFLTRGASKEAAALFRASRDALSKHLARNFKEHYVSSSAIEYGRDEAGIKQVIDVSIPGWNDSITSQLADAAWRERQTPQTQEEFRVQVDDKMAKSVVINAMEATAKDLRNG